MNEKPGFAQLSAFEVQFEKSEADERLSGGHNLHRGPLPGLSEYYTPVEVAREKEGKKFLALITRPRIPGRHNRLADQFKISHKPPAAH